MRATTLVRSRRAVAAALLALSAAVLGACEGTSPVQPGAGALSYGDTTGVPGDTVGTPGDTVGVPGDTVGVPGDTVGVPGDTLRGNRRSQLAVSVVAAADSGGIALIGGAVVTVTRGGSDQVVARLTTVGGYATLSVLPGRYVVRLESVPAGLEPAPGESGEREVVVPPGERLDVKFHLQH
ncbi:MAG TPA: hypothetical protein VF615_29705 [Longimicrobiaceae bacterium]|jgi:hypothetical protein